MTKRGRPKKPAGEKLCHPVEVMLNDGQLEALDENRGELSRAEALRRAAQRVLRPSTRRPR